MSDAAELAQSQSKWQIEDIVPLNVCLKYQPPCIALHYSLKPEPGLNYLHVTSLQDLINESTTAEELYPKLLLKDPAYLSPAIIDRRQLLRLLEQLLACSRTGSVIEGSGSPQINALKMKNPGEIGVPKGDLGKKAISQAKDQEEARATEKSGEVSEREAAYLRQLSIESAAVDHPVLVSCLDDVKEVAEGDSDASFMAIQHQGAEEVLSEKKQVESKPVESASADLLQWLDAASTKLKKSSEDSNHEPSEVEEDPKVAVDSHSPQDQPSNNETGCAGQPELKGRTVDVLKPRLEFPRRLITEANRMGTKQDHHALNWEAINGIGTQQRKELPSNAATQKNPLEERDRKYHLRMPHEEDPSGEERSAGEGLNESEDAEEAQLNALLRQRLTMQ